MAVDSAIYSIRAPPSGAAAFKLAFRQFPTAACARRGVSCVAHALGSRAWFAFMRCRASPSRVLLNDFFRLYFIC